MFKTIPGKSGHVHHADGNGMRVRNAEFPSVPVNVSGAAQTQPLPLDMNIIRQFNFAQLDRSAISERPSTSGGPAKTTDFGFRKDAWKRETRDDLDFPLPSHSKQVIYYDFPVPGGLLTPGSSPRDHLPPRSDSLTPTTRPEAVEVDYSKMAVREMEIGMAIGSPTQAPPSWQSHVYAQTYNPSPDPTEMSMDGRMQPPPKQKSKWKVFGGLFGSRKHTPPAQNFYQLQAERSPEAVRVNQPIRGWTTSESAAEKRKPDVQRSNTPPNRYNPPQQHEPNPEIVIDGSRVVEEPQLRPQPNLGRMLDVDIPNVEMERYSIMFGSLLGQPSKSTPSLLIRRQATLEKLKVVNEELAVKERELEAKEKQLKQPRRATSPQPTRSPAFSLFPNTLSRDIRTAARTPSPNGRLVRSNTSPAALSPSRPSFAPGPDNEIHATLMEPGPHIPVSTGYDTDISAEEPRLSVTPKPLTIKKKTEGRPVVKAVAVQATRAKPEELLSNRTYIPEHSKLSQSPESGDIYATSPLPSTTYKPVSDSRWESIPRTTPTIKSISGSTTSHSDHSASASGSSSISTTSVMMPAPLSVFSGALEKEKQPRQSSDMVRNSSPKPEDFTKNVPVPISKFTAPPQTHKTRGRSQTTSSSSRSKSQIPRPSSRPRANGPTEISGPTNLSSTPLPSEPSNTGFKFANDDVRIAGNREKRYSEDGNDEEMRIERLADVSIARQISVSRQQRQLLVPIKGSQRVKTRAEATSSTTDSLEASAPTTNRPAMRKRASTIATTASSGTRIHDHNFPSPGQKMNSNSGFSFGTGVNVASVTSPLAAVERAVGDLSPSASMSNFQKLKKEVEKERKELYQGGVRAATPKLVIVGGNVRERGGDDEWEGAVVNPRKTDGIAERRRRARAEKMGAGGDTEERRGHGYKKSEKVVFERV